MKKILIITLIILSSIPLFSQQNTTDYFLGKRTYCTKPTDERSVKIYNLGLRCIRENKFLGAANEIFIDLIKKDSTFCDAYFLAGYTMRMSKMNKEAVVMYYMADSLAQNRSLEFKQNLATVSLFVGGIELSRKKFKEITQFFPDSPEGYYGLALTSLFIKDHEHGLENINIAEKKYTRESTDCQSLKAILLTLNKKYEEALPYFEKVENKFKNDDTFNGCYALSLKESGLKNADQKKLKQAQKYYEKVNNKKDLPELVKESFKDS